MWSSLFTTFRYFNFRFEKSIINQRKMQKLKKKIVTNEYFLHLFLKIYYVGYIIIDIYNRGRIQRRTRC